MTRLHTLCSVLCNASRRGVGLGERQELKLIPANVHWGYFDSGVKPVLRIASRDTVPVETMLTGGMDRLKLAGSLTQKSRSRSRV